MHRIDERRREVASEQQLVAVMVMQCMRETRIDEDIKMPWEKE